MRDNYVIINKTRPSLSTLGLIGDESAKTHLNFSNYFRLCLQLVMIIKKSTTFKRLVPISFIIEVNWRVSQLTLYKFIQTLVCWIHRISYCMRKNMQPWQVSPRLL
jgi:hypothetical protein